MVGGSNPGALQRFVPRSRNGLRARVGVVRHVLRVAG